MGQQLSLLEENINVAQTKQLEWISREGLEELQNRVCEEYPFIRNIHESVLVTDPSRPDNPIIFCNDSFQRMTLYPREEIVGKNCRFLQGKYTSQAAVQRIREAVKAGKELDIQLLNYRKNGAPFWNNFLMLPVHKSKQSKEVTHFIAIQKDVTYLKQGHKDPQKWSPREVALFVTYLERLESPDYSMNAIDIIIEQRINGARFLAATEEDWVNYGVTSEAARKNLLEAIVKLESDSQQFVRRIIDDYDYMYYEPQPDSPLSYSPPDGTIDLLNPRQLQFWNQQPAPGTCVKFYYQGYVDVSNESSDLTFEQLK